MQAPAGSMVMAKVGERIRQSMKTHRHLYDEIISDKNIELAIKEACKSRKKSNKKRAKLDRLKLRPDRVDIVRGWIENYKEMRRIPHEIYDGIARKKRNIYVPSVRETVVQHAVVQILNQHLMTGIYEHTYAAIKGRGQHKAKKYIEKYIREHSRGVKYYLKMDIKQYFPSVPQDRLIAKLKREVKDTRTVELVKKILYASEDGIPLGYFISQWFANYYLRDMDHRIKQMVGGDMYVRWMDDMVIFSGNKRDLHRYKDEISGMLEGLGLRLKDNWRIQRFDHPKGGCFLDYMGFRFYRNRTTMRRSIMYRITRKARKIAKKDKPTIYEIKQFMSYVGWLSHSDTYGIYTERVKPYVDIQYMKRRISRYDKRRARDDISDSTRQRETA